MKKYPVLLWFLVVFTLLSLVILPGHGALAGPKEIKKVLIAGGRVGDPWYVFAQAWAHFINKKSDWLRAEVVATPGLTGNAELMRQKPKQYLALTAFCVFAHFREGEFAEKRGCYTGIRFIANGPSMTQLWITYDPNIKRPEDLIGKRVHIGRKGAANTPDHMAILRKWRILDKVKLVHGGFGGGKNKLKDGLVDVTIMIIDHIYPRSFRKGAKIAELETKKPIYYLGMSREMLLDLRKEGYSTVPVRIPAKALDPKTQPNELWAFDDVVFFCADERMDPEIVYEATRVIYETAGQWSTWHPQGAHMTKTFIPAMPVYDLKYVHPGAKKYYDQNNIKIRDLAELLR